MATVPTTHTVLDGLATSSEMNTYFRDPIDFLMNRPAARVRQTATQTITTGTLTSITFTTEDLDDDPAGTGAHSTSVNTSRYTAVYPGWYQVSGVVSFAANATGVRAASWAVNGTAINASASAIPNNGAATIVDVPAPTIQVFLNVGDYVELQGYHERGANLDTFVSGQHASSMDVQWVRLV